MTMKTFKLFIIVIFFCITFAIFIPIVILSDILFPYEIISDSEHYSFNTDDPASIEELNIKAEVGDIEIRYILEPVDFAVKIDVFFELGGKGLADKMISDFFNLDWQDSSNKLNYTLLFNEEINPSYILSTIRKIQINVSIRANVNCNFDIEIFEGSANLVVPFGVSVGNIKTKITIGEVQFNFSHCTIDGNITGIIEYGNLVLKTNHIQYSRDCTLTFINYYGITTIEIIQDCEIGANITGVGITETGVIDLTYRDYSSNIGAQFILNNKRNWGDYPAIGFEHVYLPSIEGQKFYSFDYPSQHNYNFSLLKPYYYEGDYLWDLYSIPIS